ncbi:MAG: CarD family transcriptional regulator [Chloroflexota bacterium]|nr:CarD family transcriptional regulator [Chloroflexota bacterium]
MMNKRVMVFKVGDAIVHPVRGAGVVVCIEERQWRGSNNLYYRIKLLGQPASSLMVPISAAETIGLRHAIPRSQLSRVWRVLRADPKILPSDHKERYQVLEDQLHAGNVLQVAAAVKDMAWRKQQEGNLTTRGKRMYDEGMMLLAGEIAATQDIDLTDAEAQIRAKLSESLSLPAVV